MPPLRQVERNREGSRPKELFNDMIEDMEGEYEKVKVRAPQLWPYLGPLQPAAHTHMFGPLQPAAHTHMVGTLQPAAYAHVVGTLQPAAYAHVVGTLQPAAYAHVVGTLQPAAYAHVVGTLQPAAYTTFVVKACALVLATLLRAAARSPHANATLNTLRA